jgi:hypothetical protein
MSKRTLLQVVFGTHPAFASRATLKEIAEMSYVVIIDDIEHRARMVRKEKRDGKTVTILTLVPPKESS